jgi:hypothetical protein
MTAKSRKFDSDNILCEQRVTTETLRKAVQAMLNAATEAEVVKAWKAARKIKPEGPLADLPDPMAVMVAKHLEADLERKLRETHPRLRRENPQRPQSDLGIGRGRMLSLLHHTIQSEIQADPEASNRAIGRRLGISHNTVLKVRRAMVA